MARFLIVLSFCVLPLFLFRCADVSSSGNSIGKTATPSPDPIYFPVHIHPDFNAYWYQGVAEVSTYSVEQERYGEMRRAEQENVFVTEDFSRQNQVKLDHPESAGADRVPVLKWNGMRKFVTGIYDYSLMQSVFTPVTGMSTVKTTASIQDWCGHVFSQINLEKEGYRQRTFSYFESEGDQDKPLPLVLLEDELWTRLRLDPAAIPLGTVKVLPGAWYLRLRHQNAEPHSAEIRLEKGEKESVLALQYTDIPRSLRIRFQTAFPYVIQGWEETDGQKILSKGALRRVRKSAYWSEHNNEHLPLRDTLQIRGGY